MSLKHLVAGAGLCLACSVAAFAHAHLQSSQPSKNATVPPSTSKVTLTFTEAVATASSTFQVCPVANDAAASQLEARLTPKTQVPGDVATGVQPTGAASAVTIKLTSPLKAGQYAVLWKVLAADDGHVTHGHYLFTVAAK